MTASVISIGTAVPDNCVSQDEIKETVRHMFGSSVPHLDRFLTIFEHSGIDSRHFCVPLEWFLLPHSVEEKHRLFVQHATALAEQAVLRCLERANLDPSAVDHLIFVTTTGTATPSIDARLCNRLSFRNNVKRTPIWGLGCAGGAAGLSRASEYVKAFPDHLCLVVSVELCSLTFLRDDTSKSNVVATSLFADGAAAVLVAGRPRGHAPRIVATQSTIWPDSLDVMGWEVTDRGLKVIFSKDIPTLVTRTMQENVGMLLHPHNLDVNGLDQYILHPGGMKVLHAYESALHLPREKLDASRKVLQCYGNMSSCTILFVLEEVLQAGMTSSPGQRYGLAGALGPGFSSELLLLDFSSRKEDAG